MRPRSLASLSTARSCMLIWGDVMKIEQSWPGDWRHSVRSPVLAAGLRPSRTKQFLYELDHLDFDELDTHMSEELELIDVRL